MGLGVLILVLRPCWGSALIFDDAFAAPQPYSSALSIKQFVDLFDTLAEDREADTDDFGGESETLKPGNSASWEKKFKRTHT